MANESQPHGSGGGAPGSNQWWVVSFPHTSGVSSRLVEPAQPIYKVVEAPTESKAKDKVRTEAAGQPISADGPFKTRADAEDALGKRKQKIASAEQAGSLPNLNPLSGIEAGFTGFFNVLTDGKMWRSLGWIALGILLLGMGVSIWLKLPQKAFHAAEEGAKVAAVAA